MPSATNVQARKTARIRASAHTVTLVFPPAFVAATVPSTPGAQPASPLTGAKPVNTLVPPAPATPIAPPLTVPCLWYDTPTAPTATAMQQDARVYRGVAWRAGAHALAEVLVADVAVNPLAPYGATQFDNVQHLEHAGQTYRVLEVRPVGAAFAAPVSYFVWLSSATQQSV